MHRYLGLPGATALVVGQVIAVGIFLTPAAMARLLASPFWLLAVWLVAGAMALCGSLVYGELAARYPEAGGGYVYLREAWGPRVAFLYGWKCCLVMDPGITAALATGLAAYVGYLVPLSPAGLVTAGIGAIAAGALVNIAGARLGAGVISALAIVKLGALAAIVIAGFAMGRGSWDHFVPFVARPAGAAPLGGALAGAFVAAFFAFGGWWEAAKLAGEVRDPAHTMPRALSFGVAIVTAAYVLTSAAFLYLVPLDAVTSDEAFAAQAGTVLFGRAGGLVFAAVVVVSIAGSLVAIQMMLPRLYYAMSRDGLFPEGLGRLHPTRGTPVRAILLQALLASILVAVGSFETIIAYFIFVTVAFIGTTVLGAMKLRTRPTDPITKARRHDGTTGMGRQPAHSPVRELPYRTPAYPLTPLVFLALVAVLLALIAGSRPLQALAGTVIVLAGLPVYAVIARSRPRAPWHQPVQPAQPDRPVQPAQPVQPGSWPGSKP